MRTLTKIMEVNSVWTFPTITVKLATSPLSPQTMLTFQQNESSNESFFGHTAVLGGGGDGKGRGGGWRDDPAKADQVVVIMSGPMYQFLGRVFSQCSTYFDLHCRTTVVPLQTATTPFFDSGGRWQKGGITITIITNCFPCPSYVHDFVRQPKIH